LIINSRAEGGWADIRFQTEGTNRMFIERDGNVGIGTTSPGYPLHMGSGARCTAGGVWINASSIKYKENVRDLSPEAALETLDSLHPVTFNYKEDKEEECVGFIAEDVPDLVATKDREGLSPMDIIGVLQKWFRNRRREYQNLKKEMAAMKR